MVIVGVESTVTILEQGVLTEFFRQAKNLLVVFVAESSTMTAKYNMSSAQSAV